MKTSEYLKQVRLAIALGDRRGLQILLDRYKIADEVCTIVKE